MTPISNSRPKLCFVVTEACTVQWFLVEHFRALSGHYEITLVTNSEDGRLLQTLGVEGRSKSMPLSRNIHPVRDSIALLKLFWFFRSERFECVHSFTPKAGLLTAIAGAVARVPLRIHTFTGQVWASRTGYMRWLLKSADKVIACLDTNLLTDSPSQLSFLFEQGVVPSGKCRVLAEGSISGVDPKKFRPDEQLRLSLRREQDVPEDALVFLFVGRLSQDKGVQDLVRAFSSVCKKLPNTFLWIVGQDEQDMVAKLAALIQLCDGRIKILGYTTAPERYMAAADVLFLPSYREGFGTVVIEAAAIGLPAVVSRIYGLTDAVEENVTGLFHPPRDVNEIAEHMVRIFSDRDLRLRLGSNARSRALERFSKETVTAAFVAYYNALLN